MVDVPKKYNIPTFTPKYSRISDPAEHIAQYKQLMWTVSIPHQYQEVCMCKSFGATLTGAALQWLINLRPESIGSFAELVNQFFQQFASSRKMEKHTSDLYYITQKIGESVQNYFYRFNSKMISVRNCDVRTAIEAYKRGLNDSSDLYMDLTKYPPENFEDIRARTLAYMRVEDDSAFRHKHSNDMKALSVKKSDFKARSTSKVETSKKISNVRFDKKKNASTNKFPQYPRISSYEFKGTYKEVFESLKNVQTNVKWPPKSEEMTPRKTNLNGDLGEQWQKHQYGLIIQLTIGNCSTKRILVDGGSYANIIFLSTIKDMGIDKSEIVRHDQVPYALGVQEVKSEQNIARDCYKVTMKPQKQSIYQLQNQVDPDTIDDYRLEEVVLDKEKADWFVFVGTSLDPSLKESLISIFFQNNADCFAWTYEYMVGIDPEVISHRLNIDPSFKPVKQKQRKFAPERNKVINEEVDNLLKTGKIREVKYPEWLENVVVVHKKNGKWRVCIDFTDLNKACPKDPFPLPHIDAMVDATARHEFLTFMDTYSGYNQILMHHDDQEKKTFMTDKGIYCYKVMPFGVKNARSTYRRLVNKMFKEHLGDTMEVYINDMLVKSKHAINHIDHLKRSFDIIKEYHMTLNPTKCSFGVSAGKFLGYMVTRRGIEANPDQIKAIMEIKFPCNLKEGFEWTSDHENALQKLKEYMASPPLLAKPEDHEVLQLYLAVNTTAISVVLTREDKKQQLPIYYIPRDQNTQANTLVNLGSTLGQSPFNVVPIIHLATPSVENENDVQAIEQEDNWSSDIGRFLTNDQLPEDKMETRKIRFKASRFGIPSEIVCDNGSQFISDRTHQFCKDRNTKLTTSTPCYSQSNRLSKSSNKTIINSIKKRLRAAKGKWAEELSTVLWANRMTPHTSTGQTPFSLVYGCEAVLHVET
ncbi:hypothetical protein L6452_22620 [Arctium lappa]|uniref:Uncharacterized protein n=1 Tax=Arctium lappa TaxID=4217 RepID=A0ACB9AZF3_ARCLA|nr:hypothetical protein L6452_22620 [Arctium lappa]